MQLELWSKDCRFQLSCAANGNLSSRMISEKGNRVVHYLARVWQNLCFFLGWWCLGKLVLDYYTEYLLPTTSVGKA